MEVLTIARYSRERDVHVHGQLLSSAPVDDDGRVDIDPPVVDELNGSKREDDRRSEKSHCPSRNVAVRLAV